MKNKKEKQFIPIEHYNKNKKIIYSTNFVSLILLSLIFILFLPNIFYENYLSNLELLWSLFGIELTVFVFVYAFIRKVIKGYHSKFLSLNNEKDIKNKFIILGYKSYFKEMNLLNTILIDITINTICLIAVTILSLCEVSIGMSVKLILSFSLSVLLITLLILITILFNYREYYYDIYSFIKNKKDFKEIIKELEEYSKILKVKGENDGKDENAE
ncbi:MAG TPA: hypothetical protein IAB72_01710 [Candidatus Onthoplasma faecipullorum]|nr:hypothetical protein [Candidatus Onthoplasma faecipullorum]